MLFWVVIIVLFSLSFLLPLTLSLSLSLPRPVRLVYGVYYLYTRRFLGGKTNVFFTIVVRSFLQSVLQIVLVLEYLSCAPFQISTIESEILLFNFRSGSMLTNACTCIHVCPQNKIKYRNRTFCTKKSSTFAMCGWIFNIKTFLLACWYRWFLSTSSHAPSVAYSLAVSNVQSTSQWNSNQWSDRCRLICRIVGLFSIFSHEECCAFQTIDLCRGFCVIVAVGVVVQMKNKTNNNFSNKKRINEFYAILVFCWNSSCVSVCIAPEL